jgi:hypothetical protein
MALPGHSSDYEREDLKDGTVGKPKVEQLLAQQMPGMNRAMVVLETLSSVKTGRGRRRMSRPCLRCAARADY